MLTDKEEINYRISEYITEDPIIKELNREKAKIFSSIYYEKIIVKENKIEYILSNKTKELLDSIDDAIEERLKQIKGFYER
jgi:hypothetical protein